MLVPFFFIIPVNDYSWPEDTWGMMLGHNVSSVRDGMSHKDHRAELESIGFDYNPQREVYGYDLVKAALLLYKDIYGNMEVPVAFVTPTDEHSWPELTWGMPLGAIANQIRCGSLLREVRNELASNGFDYGSRKLAYGYPPVKSALLKYKEVYGNMVVTREFSIPTDDDSWPEKTWGMELGSVVCNIRCGDSYNNHRAELESIGFDYSSQTGEISTSEVQGHIR